MKKLLILTTTVMTMAMVAPAFASNDDQDSNGDTLKCGKLTRQWMTEDAAKAKALELGYDVRRVKREDGCYEVYAIDKKGVRVEIYMNHVTGALVKTKVKS